jgi:hypothetical protein
MALGAAIVALSLVAATQGIVAATPEPGQPAAAPTASPDARYCLRLEPVTGTRLELVRCWTRQEWAAQGVDVDKEWSREGVAVQAD